MLITGIIQFIETGSKKIYNSLINIKYFCPQNLAFRVFSFDWDKPDKLKVDYDEWLLYFNFKKINLLIYSINSLLLLCGTIIFSFITQINFCRKTLFHNINIEDFVKFTKSFLL